MFAFDYAILGGGIIGRLLAWRLANTGARIILYEAGKADGSSSAAWVAAAMLSPLAESNIIDPLVTILGFDSLEEWPLILSKLPLPVFFQCNGTLVVWHSYDFTEYKKFHNKLHNNTSSYLLQNKIKCLNARKIENLEPALSDRFTKGLLLEGEGQLDNRQLLFSLGMALAEKNVTCLYEQKVSSKSKTNAAITIDCRGLGALNIVPGLYGIRGEIIRVKLDTINLKRPIRMLHPRYPIYIAPKQNNIFVIGATEINTNDNSPVSIRSSLELLSAAFSLHPAFGEARIIELNSHSRPTLTNHLPTILFDRHNNIIRINGLYRYGYMLAPVITSIATSLAQAVISGKCNNIDKFTSWQTSSKWPQLSHWLNS